MLLDQAHSRGVSALGLYILWGTKGISIVFLLLVSSLLEGVKYAYGHYCTRNLQSYGYQVHSDVFSSSIPANRKVSRTIIDFIVLDAMSYPQNIADCL